MISLPNEHLRFEKSLFTGSFYFRATDVDALGESLRDKVTIAYPIENFDYGMREFAIRDMNGYILQFGKEIPESENEQKRGRNQLHFAMHDPLDYN